jgi:hypothetical protein
LKISQADRSTHNEVACMELQPLRQHLACKVPIRMVVTAFWRQRQVRVVVLHRCLHLGWELAAEGQHLLWGDSREAHQGIEGMYPIKGILLLLLIKGGWWRGGQKAEQDGRGTGSDGEPRKGGGGQR